jgi:hypothetical protein
MQEAVVSVRVCVCVVGVDLGVYSRLRLAVGAGGGHLMTRWTRRRANLLYAVLAFDCVLATKIHDLEALHAEPEATETELETSDDRRPN